MVGAVRPSGPAGLLPVEASSDVARLGAAGGDVRELQRAPWVAAERSPGRRFHALHRAGQDIRDAIADLNPILRGWGDYFRTATAAQKFGQIDRDLERRLGGPMRRRYGRHLRPGQWETWTREWREAHGLDRLRGTIRSPAVSS